MDYVKSLDLFGLDVKEIPCITGNGAPNTTTPGAVGCLYMDNSNGNVYKCTAVNSGVYTWQMLGGGSAKLYRHCLTIYTNIQMYEGEDGERFETGTVAATTYIEYISSNPTPITSLREMPNITLPAYGYVIHDSYGQGQIRGFEISRSDYYWLYPDYFGYMESATLYVLIDDGSDEYNDYETVIFDKVTEV